VYAEGAPRRWIAGSNYWARTQPLTTVDETALGQVVQVAVAYAKEGEGVRITLCRQGATLASYVDGPMETWKAGNAEVVFGRRHTSETVTELGGLEGAIEEARIYGAALDCKAVGALKPG
jgi:hypothetical protein